MVRITLEQTGWRRRGASVRTRLLSLALMTLAAACTDGGPDPLDWELEDSVAPIEAHAGYTHQPERAPPTLAPPQSRRSASSSVQPRFELVDRAAAPEPDSLCPYDVLAHEFPAVSEGGATIVDVDAWSWADDMEQSLTLTRLEAGATHVDVVFDREDDRGDDGQLDCDAALVRVAKRVASLNAKLDRSSWRPLEPLDAFFSAPGFGEAMAHSGYEDAVLTELAGADRPIEVYWRNGQLIARVRGLTVLQSTPRPEWYVPDEYCVADAQVFAVEFDRVSKAALVRYTHSSGACLCDERDYVGRIELEPELLAAIDERSTAAFVAANRAAITAAGGSPEDL